MVLNYKKLVILCINILTLVVCISLIINNKIFAESIDEKNFLNIDVPAAVVMDSNSGRVLFAKNADEKRPMASLTKVMTAILLVENCDMDEIIEIPKEATRDRWL